MFSHDDAFAHVAVDHQTIGGTRVSWQFARGFCPSAPVTFGLEYSVDAAPEEGWRPVEQVEGVDVLSLVDPHRRLESGKSLDLHYRVVGQLGGVAFRSRPAPAAGPLQPREWRQARKVVQEFRLQFRHDGGIRGWLLKRLWAGTTPDEGAACSPTDYLTGALLAPGRAATAGTEFAGGYFGPVRFDVVPVSLGGSAIKADPGRGTVDDARRRRVLAEAYPRARTRDVFVEDGTDLRYAVDSVQDASLVRATPVLVALDLRQLPFDDPAYAVPVPATAYPARPDSCA